MCLVGTVQPSQNWQQPIWVFERGTSLFHFRRDNFCVPSTFSTLIALTLQRKRGYWVVQAQLEGLRKFLQGMTLSRIRDHPAFKALHSEICVEFCLVRRGSLGSNWSNFWYKSPWLQLYWSLHLSGLMSVFVLGHLNNKQKSILKMLIDVITGKGKSIMSRFYINLSYIFLTEWRLLLGPLLTYSIFSWLLSKIQECTLEAITPFQLSPLCLSGPDAALASSVHMETWGNYWANYPFSQISWLNCQLLSILDASEENMQSIVDKYAITCLKRAFLHKPRDDVSIFLPVFESIQTINSFP